MQVGGKNVSFRIEVEDNPLSILLVFDRKTDVALVPWQDAFNLANIMDQVVKDMADEFMVVYPVIDQSTSTNQQAQIRFNRHKNLVAIVVDWTDRIRFTSLQAFSLVARAMRQVAQDAHLEQEKGIFLSYTGDGMTLKSIYNSGTGLTQTVR